MTTWLKAKTPRDPWERPRIDWLASWRPFIPFWIGMVTMTIPLLWIWR